MVDIAITSNAQELGSYITKHSRSIRNEAGNFRLFTPNIQKESNLVPKNGVYDALVKTNPNISGSGKSDFLTNYLDKLKSKAPKGASYEKKAKWIIKQMKKDPEVATEVKALADKLNIKV